MKKLLAIGAILIALFIFNQPAQAQERIAGGSAVLKNEALGWEKPDPRTEQLAAFLANYDSPLVPFAANFIDSADRYQLDWRLVPAITGVESTFGKRIPFASYNAYGWANGAYRFGSWEESIEHVSRVLKEKYVDRGLDTPAKISPVYAPPSPTWGAKVAHFMAKIDAFDPRAATIRSLTLTL